MLRSRKSCDVLGPAVIEVHALHGATLSEVVSAARTAVEPRNRANHTTALWGGQGVIVLCGDDFCDDFGPFLSAAILCIAELNVSTRYRRALRRFLLESGCAQRAR